MSCDISKGKNQLACKSTVSGLKAIYLANYDDYEYVTSSTIAGHLLTDLGNLTEVFKYELKNTGNSYLQTIESSSDTGVTVYNQALTFILTNLNAEMEFQVAQMVKGRPQIFVEANNGKFFLLGLKNGMEISGTAGIGGAMNSLNGYTLNASGMEQDPAWYLDSASITALKALVSTASVSE